MLKGASGVNSAAGLSGLQRTDISGTPGSGTSNTPRGRFAIATAASAATITCSLCTANSTVICQVTTIDATLKSVVAIPGAGSFVATGNAAATLNTTVDYMVIN